MAITFLEDEERSVRKKRVRNTEADRKKDKRRKDGIKQKSVKERKREIQSLLRKIVSKLLHGISFARCGTNRRYVEIMPHTSS